MKNHIVAATLFVIAGAVSGETLFDFAREETPYFLNKSEERGQTLSSTGQALKLGWDAGKFIYAELIPRKMPELPAFVKAEFSVRVTATAGCPMRLFNLRLVDATGETFQWNQAVEWARPGSYEVIYQVTPRNADLHWGGNNDNKVDFPVRFSGFSMDFRKNSGIGELLVDSATLLTSDGKTASIRSEQQVVLADFSSSAPKLQLNQPEKRAQSAVPSQNPVTGKTALKINWDGAKHHYFEWSFTPALPLPEFSDGKVEVDLTTAGDCPVWRFNIRMIDATGETFQWEQKVDWRSAGTRRLVFDVTAENCSQSWGGDKDRKITFPVSFLGISADFRKDSGNGELLIDAIRGTFNVYRPLVEAVEFSVDTGNELHVWNRDSPPRFRFRNRLKAPVRADARLTLRDFEGNTLEEKLTLDLSPDGEFFFTSAARLPAYGIWYVTCRIAAPGNGSDYRDIGESFAYMVPAGSTPGGSKGFIFGICSHPNWTKDKTVYEREAVAMALCGAKVMRMDMEWHDIEQTPGKPDYSKYDTIVDTFARQGIELEAILGKTPKWAAVEGNRPDYDAWRAHVRSILTHYKGKIRYWEVWNEPDLVGFATFGVSEYVKLMEIVREEAKAIDPGAVILSGGFATMSAHGSQKGNFHEETLANSRGLFDVHAYHEHGPFSHYVRQVDDLFLPMRRKLAIQTPWYANETALTSAGSDERFQAVTLFKKFLFSWSRGSIGYNWYNLRNKGDNPKEGEHNYGMLTRDFHPKAVFVVYNTLAKLYKGKEFRRQLPLGDGLWAFEFGNGDETVIGAWNENFNLRADERLLLRTDAKRAEVVDLMGNAVPAAQFGNLTALTLGRTPASLRLTGATRIEPVGSLLSVDPVGLLIPGRQVAFTLRFFNPFDRECGFSYRVELPAGLTGCDMSGTLTVAPGAMAERKLALTVGFDFKLPFGEPGMIPVELRIADPEYVDTLRQPVHTATLIPAATDGRPADFRLETKEQSVSLFDADPTRTDMVWKGPDDLSARVTLGHSADALRIKVEVADDRHAQPFRGADVWQGDNVQIALELPGRAGMWEFGFSRLDSGESEVFAWSAPRGLDEKALAGAVRLETGRDGTETVYRAEIPFAVLGMTPEEARNGFRFNLLVNDNDGAGRKGWIHIAPGIGLNKAGGKFPFVVPEPTDHSRGRMKQ